MLNSLDHPDDILILYNILLVLIWKIDSNNQKVSSFSENDFSNNHIYSSFKVVFAVETNQSLICLERHDLYSLVMNKVYTSAVLG